MLSDTHPDAERVQIRLLREAGPVRRGELASSLTNSCITRAKRAIKLAYPELSPQQQQLMYIEVQYGSDLARRFEAHLERRSR